MGPGGTGGVSLFSLSGLLLTWQGHTHAVTPCTEVSLKRKCCSLGEEELQENYI